MLKVKTTNNCFVIMHDITFEMAMMLFFKTVYGFSYILKCIERKFVECRKWRKGLNAYRPNQYSPITYFIYQTS